jgi:DNA-binding NarL/FixJ family response regulator
MAARQGESKRSVRIVLVDDHQVVRSGLKTLIELEDDLVVVGEAGTAGEAVRRTEIDRPDLVVMDVRLPDRSGISACNEITRRFPDVKVLILTSYADEVALAAAVTAGASGYVLKRARASEIVEDLRRVMAGELLFDQRGRNQEPEPLLSPLSAQERTLSWHLAGGLTNREIADRMGLSEKTVKNYVSSVLTKLGMSRRSEAAAFLARVEAMAGSPLVDEEKSSSPCGSRGRGGYMVRL